MTILHAKHRLLICKMLLQAGQIAHNHYMPKAPFGTLAELHYVSLCVLIGHLEGRPFTAAKLATYLECPRTTVLRRLEQLLRAGLIVRRQGAYFMNAEALNSPQSLAAHSAVRRLVIMTGEQLSKLDTKEVQ